MSNSLPIVAILTLSLVGCATISDDARKVQVHSQVSSILSDCEKLGPVDASTSFFQLGSTVVADLDAQLRQATFELGGDSVAIINSEQSPTRYFAQGVAFRCYE